MKDKKIDAPESYTNIGEQYIDKVNKTSNDTVQVRELTEQVTKNFKETLNDTAFKAKGKFNSPYYIVVLVKLEKLISKAVRRMFFARQSCPTPSFGQMVYMFDSNTEEFTLLWMIPPKKLCIEMYNQRYDLALINDPILKYVVDFVEGNLFMLSNSLNKKHLGE